MRGAIIAAPRAEIGTEARLPRVPEEQLTALDSLCRDEGISRAEAVRRAVTAHVRQHRAGQPDKAYGLWRGKQRDGLKYQERLRREWERPREAR